MNVQFGKSGLFSCSSFCWDFCWLLLNAFTRRNIIAVRKKLASHHNMFSLAQKDVGRNDIHCMKLCKIDVHHITSHHIHSFCCLNVLY